jgi:hypothetical protein
MTGADNDWFWLISSAHKKPHVILFVGGSSVEIELHSTRGYRDIISCFYTANSTNKSAYRFNGQRYVCPKSLWTDAYTPSSK